MSDIRQYMGDNIMEGALIMTYYGAAFLEIRHYSIIMGFFFIQFIPSFVLFMIDVWREIDGVGSTSTRQNMLIEGFFAFLFLFWLVLYVIKEDAK